MFLQGEAFLKNKPGFRDNRFLDLRCHELRYWGNNCLTAGTSLIQSHELTAGNLSLTFLKALLTPCVSQLTKLGHFDIQLLSLYIKASLWIISPEIIRGVYDAQNPECSEDCKKVGFASFTPEIQ